PLLDTVIKINLEQPQRIIQIIKKHFTELKGLRVAVLGLAFKPDTDDMRESPAISIINTLLKEGSVIKAYDPVAMSAARKVLPAEQVSFENSLECVLSDIDVVILVTRWDQFNGVPNILKAQKSPPLLVDGRRMLNKEDILRYDGIGL
ncbi:MAG: UDP-glucose/GDP-mannose dehydrogenase family protein, partial [Gammaproteobacteria bacterium]|nr:UDP-glucose/GDP-mannose dehydrogenase family protein [Gammaproteobacteria bacterium]